MKKSILILLLLPVIAASVYMIFIGQEVWGAVLLIGGALADYLLTRKKHTA